MTNFARWQFSFTPFTWIADWFFTPTPSSEFFHSAKKIVPGTGFARTLSPFLVPLQSYDCLGLRAKALTAKGRPAVGFSSLPPYRVLCTQPALSSSSFMPPRKTKCSLRSLAILVHSVHTDCILVHHPCPALLFFALCGSSAGDGV